MRILHTSDWHIGATLKGQSRLPEQIAVFAELVELTRTHKPDLVIVAGDLFETAAPSAAAQKLLVRTLSALRATGADVIAVAGNHDHGAALDALRGWADAAGITLRGTIGKASDHLISGRTADGEDWQCAALPFVSQRYAVRATELFDLTAAETGQSYTDHLRRLVAALSASFMHDRVNLVTGHLTVVGGKLGGGEREAHTVADYAVPSTIFPPTTHYVALGHLHRRQKITAGCPVHYSGGPIAVDFGEETYTPGVLMVDVSVDTPAEVTHIPLSEAVPLRTLRGDLEELRNTEVDPRAWLRVFVKEKSRAGLRDEIQELFPRALAIRIDPSVTDAAQRQARPSRAGRTPRQLFGDYLREKGVDDPAVTALFDRLHDRVSTVSEPSEKASLCVHCGWKWKVSVPSRNAPASISPAPTSSHWSAPPAPASRRSWMPSASRCTVGSPAGARVSNTRWRRRRPRARSSWCSPPRNASMWPPGWSAAARKGRSPRPAPP